MNNILITVEVAYALPEQQYIKKIVVKPGTTVEKAINISSLLKEVKNIDLTKNKIGIYSKFVNLTDKVKNGDRIEIYRPMLTNSQKTYRKRKNKE